MGCKKKRDSARDLCQLLVWSIPKQVKRRFKKVCKQRHISMRGAVIEFLIQYPDLPCSTSDDSQQPTASPS